MKNITLFVLAALALVLTLYSQPAESSVALPTCRQGEHLQTCVCCKKGFDAECKCDEDDDDECLDDDDGYLDNDLCDMDDDERRRGYCVYACVKQKVSRTGVSKNVFKNQNCNAPANQG